MGGELAWSGEKKENLMQRTEGRQQRGGKRAGRYAALPILKSIEGCRGSDVEKGLVKVRDDVFHIFNAHTEADKAVGNADAVADLFGHRRVSHLRRQGDQRFDSAQTLRRESRV